LDATWVAPKKTKVKVIPYKYGVTQLEVSSLKEFEMPCIGGQEP
jgi:hypothetical protein